MNLPQDTPKDEKKVISPKKVETENSIGVFHQLFAEFSYIWSYKISNDNLYIGRRSSHPTEQYDVIMTLPNVPGIANRAIELLIEKGYIYEKLCVLVYKDNAFKKIN